VSSQFTVKVLMAALGLPTGDEALVDEQTVRDNAVLMVQSDARTRAKGPEHIAAYNWMQDYAGKVIAMRRAEPRNDLISHFSLAEDRRRPPGRPRSAAHHHHPDHGRRGKPGRLHDDVRLQPGHLRRGAPRRGGQPRPVD
jgi:hypothetical protein